MSEVHDYIPSDLTVILCCDNRRVDRKVITTRNATGCLLPPAGVSAEMRVRVIAGKDIPSTY